MVLRDSAAQSNWEVSAHMGKEVDNSCATTQADSLRDTMATIAQDGYRNNEAVNAGRLDRNTNDAVPKGLPNITIDFGTTDGSNEQPKGHQPIDGGKAKTQEQLDKEDESKDRETEDTDDDDHDAEDDDNETDDTVIHERIHEADGGGTAGGQGDGVDVSVVARMAADAAIQAALSGASQDAASGIGTELGLSIIQSIGARGGIERSAAAQAGVSISMLARAGAAGALAGRRSGAAEAEAEVAKDIGNGPSAGGEGVVEGSRPQAGPVDENGNPLRPLPSNQNPSDGSWEKPKSKD